MTQPNAPWDERKSRVEHEYKKEMHHWRLEWFAAALVAVAAIACIVALVHSGGTASWAQTLLCTISGAALAFAMKPSAGAKPPDSKP